MIFESKVLKKYTISENYYEGEFEFSFLSNVVDVQYSIIDTVENAIIGQQKTNRFEKFTDLENLFIKFLNFFDKNEYENYKKVISQELADESLINLTPEEKENERLRLCKEIELRYIDLEWTKRWDMSEEDIVYKESYQIGMRFLDEKYIDEREIYVDIDSNDFKVEFAYFEAM